MNIDDVDMSLWRRSAFKSKHDMLVSEKVAEFNSRGEDTLVIKRGMYSLIFIRREKELNVKPDKKADTKVEPGTVVQKVRKARGTKAAVQEAVS